MSRVQRLAALVCVFALAGCKKAELGEPVPTGITVSVDETSLTADDGSVTVNAIAYEDGIALLDETITFEITGTVSAPAVQVQSDAATGVATHTFSNLRLAGTGTVSARAGSGTPVTDSILITVTPGAVTSISLTPDDQNVLATDGSVVVAATASDANLNAVPGATIALSTNAPGATIGTGSVDNLRIAGDWSIYGAYGTFAVTTTASISVLPGPAAQVNATLAQPVVGQVESIRFDCAQLDQFGNDLTAGATFAAGTGATTNPASTVTAIAGTAGAFQASGFPGAGIYQAQCNDGAFNDSASFQVAAQTAGNTVLASLDQSVVEAGTTATLTCREFDGFGNPTATPFVTGDVTILNDAAVVQAQASIVQLTDFTFTIGNLLVEDGYVARCTKNAVSGEDDFAVLDRVAPVLGVTVTSATPHNGSLTDGRHGAGESITFTANATDAVGVDVIYATVVSAGLFSLNATSFPQSGTTVSVPIGGTMLAQPTFSTVTVRFDAYDDSGNVSSDSVTLTLDPGATLPAAAGVSIRTHFEKTGADVVAIATSSSAIYMTSLLGAADEIRHIPGEGTASTLFASDFISGMDDQSTFGLVHVPGGFGGRELFQTVVGGTGNILGFASGVQATHSTAPTDVRDLCFRGGAAQSLFYIEQGAAEQLFAVDAAGAATLLYDDTVADSIDLGAHALACVGNDVWLAENSGDVLRFDGTTGTLMGAAATFGPSSADDLVVGTKILVAGNTTVFRAQLGGVIEDPISTAFTDPTALALDAANVLYVADRVGGMTRIYRVTGY